MGTKVQCKSYLPGYYSMRDLDEDTSSGWFKSYDEKALNGQLYNSLKLRPVNEYSLYDKEMLKRTMLEHEAIFRKQVYELHRLYRIQKDLMEEIRRKQLYRSSILMETSQSNLFSSQVTVEVGKKICQMPTSYNGATVAVTDDEKSPLYFLNQCSLQSAPSENRGSLKDDQLLEPKLKRLPKRMFDLHLPADVYIESEDAERMGRENVVGSFVRAADPVNMVCGVKHENDVKLTLGTGEDPLFKEHGSTSDPHRSNGLSANSLADMKLPIDDLHGEPAAGLVSPQFNDMRMHHEEIQGCRLRLRSSTSFLERNFFTDRHKGTCTNFLAMDHVGVKQEWPSFDNDCGQSRGAVNSFNSSLCYEKHPMSSESIQLKLKKACEIQKTHHNKKETLLGENTTVSIEASGRSTHLVNSNQCRSAASQITSTLSVVSCLDNARTMSSPASPWRRQTNSISHVPIAVQALPCFNGSAMINVQRKNSSAKQNHNNACDKWQCNGDMKSQSRVGSESSYPIGFRQNGFHHGFQMDPNSSVELPAITFNKPDLNDSGNNLGYENSESHRPLKCFKGLQCTDIKSAKHVGLDQAVVNGIQDGFTPQQNGVPNHNESSRGVLGLGTMPACIESADIKEHGSQMELGISKNYSQMSSCDVVGPESERKNDEEKGPSQCSVTHSLDSSLVRESKVNGNEASDFLSSKRILGFPFPGNNLQSSMYKPSVSCCKQLLADDTECCAKGKGVGRAGMGLRNDINLNSAVIPVDELEDPSSISLPRVAGKNGYEIDLETPIDALEEGITYSQAEIIGMNHPKAPIPISSSKLSGSLGATSSHDTPLQVAAETIVSMSLGAGNHVDSITLLPVAPTSCDTLCWFAEVVSFYTESAGDPAISDEDELDLFESMTLKLEEMKADEYCCKPVEEEPQKDEGTGTASLLLTKPRRGAARKRRQRRDFQKDILPGLASLSRHEVTEDLQTIGGLMRASGKSWQAGLSRRNTGGNGPCGQARGRRRPRSLAVTVAEDHVTPPAQPTYTELDISGRSMLGWGRTTRRCRRQRFAAGAASASQN